MRDRVTEGLLVEETDPLPVADEEKETGAVLVGGPAHVAVAWEEGVRLGRVLFDKDAPAV